MCVRKGMHMTELKGEMTEGKGDDLDYDAYEGYTKQTMVRYSLKTDYFSVTRKLITAGIPVIQ